MRISGRVFLSSAERVQRLPAPFLSELSDLRAALSRRGRKITDLGRFAISIPLESNVVSNPSVDIKSVFAEYLRLEHSVDIDPEREMLLVPGTKVALLLLSAYFADEETTFHFPDPGYEAYRTSALLFNSPVKEYPLYQRNDFLPNLELFSSTNRKTASVIVINSPHNPTGAVCDNSFYERLRKVAAASNLFVIADSAYALISSGNFQPGLFCENRRRLRVGLELFSFSTGLCAPGLKLTAIIGRRTAIQPLAAMSKLLSLEPSPALLSAASAYFNSAAHLRTHLNNCRTEIAGRTKLIIDELKDARIEYFPVCHSGFVWIKLRHRRVSLSFARSLLRQRGVMVAPGSAFGEQGESWIRICANVGGKELTDAMKELVRHCQPIKSRLGEIRHD